MTAFRFRVKFDPDPTSHWRDIVIGSERTLQELQPVINEAFGLDQDHLWFFGTEEDYWNSALTYESPQEIEHGLDLPLGVEKDVRDANTTTIREFVSTMGLGERDRFCYLYDYGDEWRFYAILKEIREGEPSDHSPTVTNEKGTDLRQYSKSGGAASGVPSPVADFLPDGPVKSSEVQAMEEHEAVELAIPIHEYPEWDRMVVDRLLVQLAAEGYILEFFPTGWQIVKEVSDEDLTRKEQLAELVEAAREWHEEIAEMAGAAANREFSDAVIEDMHSTLHAELERRGFDELAEHSG